MMLELCLGTIQQLMNRILQEFLDDFVIIYLDNIIINTEFFLNNI